jgi:hypothetical protein
MMALRFFKRHEPHQQTATRALEGEREAPPSRGLGQRTNKQFFHFGEPTEWKKASDYTKVYTDALLAH